jgi:hypothetical protein
MVALETSRRYEISWEYSLILVTNKESSQKDWDIYSSVRREINIDCQY